MKKNIVALLASGLFLTACDYNDKNFDGLDDLSKPGDIAKIEYTLTADDYSKLVAMPANKTLAAKLDGEDESKPFTAALGQIKSKLAFNDLTPAKDFAPAFLADKWYSKDENSAVLLTYNIIADRPEYLNVLDKAAEYTVSAEDYEAVWGDVEAAHFTPEKPFAKSANDILKEGVSEAEEGDLVVANYAFSIIEPGGGGEVSPYYLNEDFDSWSETDVPWDQQNLKGSRDWVLKEYNANKYLQFSAFKSGSVEEAYLLTPIVNLKESAEFSFDVNVGNFNGDCLTVLVSTDYTGDVAAAKWDDITANFTIPQPEKGYANFAPAGTFDLKDYIGKKVVFAFLYKGNGVENTAGAVTTTVQIDNVAVTKKAATRSLGSRSTTAVSQESAIYQLKGGSWLPYNKATVLSADDYKAMGIKEFNSKVAPEKYVPKFLAQTYPYANEEEIVAVLYKYDGAFSSAEYVMGADKWGAMPYFEVETSQFVFMNSEWKYNPSTLVVLPVERNNAVSSSFYQAITDWVWENIDKKELGLTDADIKAGKGYMTSYGNNEYYFGASAYQNNMDLRAGQFTNQYPAGYEGLSNDEIIKKVMDRYPLAFKAGLEAIYPEVDTIEGIEIIYTVDFGVYDGANRGFTIKFEVVGKGQFEYVKDSLKEKI